MKYVLCINDNQSLELAKRIPGVDILIRASSFTKTGLIKESELGNCIGELREEGKYLTLDWDLTCTDRTLNRLSEQFRLLSQNIDSVRFRDPGLGYWLQNQYPHLPRQLSLENYSFNLPSITKWIDQFAAGIERVILSNQIPISEICDWRKKIDIEVEVQGVGAIEGFSSARSLLTARATLKKSQSEAVITGKDRKNITLSAVEHSSGTTLYFDESLFLLDELSEIESSGVDFVRLYFKEPRQYQTLIMHFPDANWVNKLRSQHRGKLTKGFFFANETNNTFSELTNVVLQEGKSRQIGTVKESAKQSYTLIELQQKLDLLKELLLITPDGREILYKLGSIKSLSGITFSQKAPPGYYLLPWIKHAVSSTIVQLKPDTSST